MAAVEDRFPLYAEAINEKGLAMAGLNFLKSAVFSNQFAKDRSNIATFELIPWVLGQADDLIAAKTLLKELNLCNTAFRNDLLPAQLHWFITDGADSLVLESTQKGLRIYENPFCVLTNNPPFPYQAVTAISLLGLKNEPLAQRVSESLGFSFESLGRETLGVPGDYSSSARFARAVWLTQRAVPLASAHANLATCFQILSSVAPIHGSVCDLAENEHYTLYSVAANLTKGEFYWRGADSPFVTSVTFSELDFDGNLLTVLDPKQLQRSC